MGALRGLLRIVIRDLLCQSHILRREDGANHLISGDARRQTAGRGSCLCGAWSERAAGVQDTVRGSRIDALPQSPSRRDRRAAAHPSTGAQATSVRLPAPACVAWTGGMAHEPQTLSTALP